MESKKKPWSPEEVHPLPEISFQTASPYRKRLPLLALAALVLAMPVAGFGSLQVAPSFAPTSTRTALVVDGHPAAAPALVDEAGRVFISFTTVLEEFDPGARLNVSEGKDILDISTAGKTIAMNSDLATDFVNRSPVTLSLRVVHDEYDTHYLPIDFFANLYDLAYTYFPGSNTVVVDRPGQEIDTARVSVSQTYLRSNPSNMATRLAVLVRGDELRLYGSEDGWAYVMDDEGRMGYVSESRIRDGGSYTPVGRYTEGESYQRQEIDGPLNLVWEQDSTGGVVNPADIPEMPGVNVVSPTWYHVADPAGRVYNGSDMLYVDWAHTRGYQVWGLVTNGFDRYRTREFLPDPAKRESIIRQLLIYSKLYRLDGINMDFEAMNVSEKDDYVALMREMEPLVHAEGMTLSVDVSFLSTSEIWSLCFDRAALAEVSDYVMVMAYDEHTSASNPGSVGSLPWVDYGVSRIINEAGVPVDKLVLGVPFYARAFGYSGGKGKVVTYSMTGVKKLISERGLYPAYDPATGQNYMEFDDEGYHFRIWIEDETSMTARIDLMKKYGLAGIAAWSRLWSDEEIYKVIDRELHE